MGGVGKTRLAVEYAWQHADNYSAVLFITADSTEALHRNIAQLAGAAVLNLEEKKIADEEERLAAVLRWLAVNPGWFLILDNVDTEAAATAVEQMLTRLRSGSILITSRLGNWRGSVTPLELDVLSSQAAAEFLLERTQQEGTRGRKATATDKQDALTIAESVDGLALALEQAAAYINTRRRTFSEYRQHWQQFGQTVQAPYNEVAQQQLPPERQWQEHPLADGHPPDWASAWGEDQYGPWAEFTVKPVVMSLKNHVTQRLRWIAPGSFQLGSPEGESGRWSDEGPQRWEELEVGFWIFDTACRQELWEAVLGVDSNKSRFRGRQRPVENVSWKDCEVFLASLNGQLSGIQFELPSELQWEYASRAGTSGPLYHVESQLGDPGFEGALSAIAWWSGNSDGQTHPVGELQANGWGLYDMLGNVWEWCSDPWRSDYDSAASDVSTAALRVCRGGSWFLDARCARAAYRYRNLPSLRHGGLGFRCSSSREPMAGPSSY